MESILIKLKGLSPIIVSLVEKVQILDSLTVTRPQKIEHKKEMLEIVDSIRAFFSKALKSMNTDECTRILTERLEIAFSKFDWDANVGISSYEFQKYSENAKTLISSVLKLLGIKGCGIIIIETYLYMCLKILTDIKNEEENHHFTELTRFKSFMEAVIATALTLKKYWHISFLPNQKNSIMFCLIQICKILPFFFKVTEAKNSNIKKFAIKQLEQYFQKILEDIHCDGELEIKDSGQEFITIMNYCLYKMDEIANANMDFTSLIEKAHEVVDAVKPMIDELLCYAMSIAQITDLENENTAIIDSSQKLLKHFKSLINNINEENETEIKIDAKNVGEAMCQLEKKVNTAVLHLVLYVFSGVNCPLKNIVNKCRTDIFKDNKALDDLNILISDFDTEMDKIIQIGFFAVACSSDSNRIIRIQSCLATLQSLEPELILSLTSLYMNCNSKHKYNFQLLIDLWLKEMTELKVLIDSILDPAGFSEIVEVEIEALLKKFCNIRDEDLPSTNEQSILSKVILFSRKLIKMLKTSMTDESFVGEETENLLKNFQLAVQECEAMLKLIETEVDKQKTKGRVLKRLEYLHGKLIKLSSHLFDLVSGENSSFHLIVDSTEPSHTFKTMIPQADYYKPRASTPEESHSNIDLDILTPYINKGILKNKRRNVINATPTQFEGEFKEDLQILVSHARLWDRTPISKKRSRCCKPLNLNLELGNSIDLEVTTILENLTQLSCTFSKSIINENGAGDGAILKEEDSNKERRNMVCGTEKSAENSYRSNGCCANLSQTGTKKVDKQEKDTNECNYEENNSLGNQFRSRFLQSLNDLNNHTSLFLTTEEDTYNEIETPDRISDLKKVEEKINFLKRQVPCILP